MWSAFLLGEQIDILIRKSETQGEVIKDQL